MNTAIILGSLILLSIVLHWLWTSADARRDAKAQAIFEDLASMGELIPESLHPHIDPTRCIGSGACTLACPEKEVIAVVGGLATLINPLGCVGHGACERSCPVGAISLVFGTATRGVELPSIDSNFQTTRPGVYVIGELGGMGLIRNAVLQGRQAADHVVAESRSGKGDALDAIVVGAGPAGISAALRLREAGLKTLILEREAFGGTITHYPRGKVVMTGPLPFPKYGMVRKRTMSKEQLVELWKDILAREKLPVAVGELVTSVQAQTDGMWIVQTNTGSRAAANVLLALGRRGSPRKIGVPGEEQSKVHYRLLEPAEFDHKHVLVVGGGNSAVESALSLNAFGGCASVGISYRQDKFARCRGSNRSQIDQAIADKRVAAHLSTEVREIGPRTVTLRDKSGATYELPNDAIIVQIGGTSPAQLFGDFGVETVIKLGER